MKTMNKTEERNLNIAVVIVVVLFIMLLVLFANTLADNDYTLMAEVMETSPNGQLVTFVDESGNFWEYYDENRAYTVGEEVFLQMGDCGTASIFDDEILKIY